MPSRSRRIAIVGSGPAGYTAALYAARAGLAPILFEGSVEAGGALATTTTVENFPGHPDGIAGPELMARMRAQAVRFGCEMVREDVTRLDLSGIVKQLTTADGAVLDVDAVIVATGAAHKRLGLPREDALTGRGVSSCATCDGAFHRDQHVAVVGGGDTALEEALFLTRFASLVTIVHRRRAFRASKVMQARALEHPRINVRWSSEVIGLDGEARLEAVELQDTTTGTVERLSVGGLFVAIGHRPNSQLVTGQLPVDDDGYVLVEHPSTTTAVPGVFACGDLVDRRYRQAVTAAGTGCAAALDAQHYLDGLRWPGEAPRQEDARSIPVPPVPNDRADSPAEAVDEHSLSRVLSTSPVPVLVDFWSDDCAPCQLMHPVLDRIAERFADRMDVVKVNVTANPAVVQDYAISSSPTMQLFVDGAVTHTIVGAMPEGRLTAELEPFLA
jgi:thioredoxin reductase (NADPH)